MRALPFQELFITVNSVRKNARLSVVVASVLLLVLLCINSISTWRVLASALPENQAGQSAAWLSASMVGMILVAGWTLSVLYAKFASAINAGLEEQCVLRKANLVIQTANRDLELRIVQSAQDLSVRTSDLAQSATEAERLQEFSAQLEKFVAIRTRDLELRTQQLEVANRELESFSYSVSHDLRAPLRAVHGFAEILSRRQRTRLDEQGQHYLDNILRASANMGMLIDDLLTFSRLGRSAVKLRSTDTGALIEQILRTSSLRINELRAQINVPSGLPTVMGDLTLLGQIFSNLIDNALTYSHRDVAPNVGISVNEAGDAWIFAVSDNGIGIAPEQFEKIFQPFQRLHSYDQYPGTGIGLALVKKAAELLGGKVWVASSPGKGSTFYFTLPKATDAADPGPQPEEKGKNHV
jgi:signal transduction histidine kinase